VLKAAGPTLTVTPGLLSPGVQYAVIVAVLLAGQVLPRPWHLLQLKFEVS
jgi:hypothetical protein